MFAQKCRPAQFFSDEVIPPELNPIQASGGAVDSDKQPDPQANDPSNGTKPLINK